VADFARWLDTSVLHPATYPLDDILWLFVAPPRLSFPQLLSPKKILGFILRIINFKI
jgi:hypothetical protein